MRRYAKRFSAVASALVLALTAVFVGGGVANASPTHHNDASSTATNHHHSAFDVAFQVQQLFSDEINGYNEANALSMNCDGCRSVAIAFQILVDGRSTNSVHVGNYATAVNYKCNHCQTLGEAYQFVVAKGIVLTAADYGKLWSVDWKLQQLRWSHAPVSTVAGQVDDLAGQVAAILANAGHGQGVWPIILHFLTWHD